MTGKIEAGEIEGRQDRGPARSGAGKIGATPKTKKPDQE